MISTARITQDENDPKKAILAWTIIPSHEELLHKFLTYYEETGNGYICPSSYPKLIPRDQRICWFCKEKMPQVTFKKTAHMIPQLLGNKYGIYGSECDTCNSIFSKYENDLANYLGLQRTLSFLKGQSGVPKYVSPDKMLKASQLPPNGERPQFKLVSEAVNGSHFEIDDEEKKFIINTERHSYRPINVYRAFLKIALMLLEENDLPDYTDAFSFLLNESYSRHHKEDPFFNLYSFFIPGPAYTAPMVFLFRKKESMRKKNVPKIVACIYSNNYMHQIFLPFSAHDLDWIKRYKKGFFITCPPLVDKSWVEKYGEPQHSIKDMSGIDLEKGEPHRITMSFKEHEKIIGDSNQNQS